MYGTVMANVSLLLAGWLVGCNLCGQPERRRLIVVLETIINHRKHKILIAKTNVPSFYVLVLESPRAGAARTARRTDRFDYHVEPRAPPGKPFVFRSRFRGGVPTGFLFNCA